jgi:hypothetical protein
VKQGEVDTPKRSDGVSGEGYSEVDIQQPLTRLALLATLSPQAGQGKEERRNAAARPEDRNDAATSPRQAWSNGTEMKAFVASFELSNSGRINPAGGAQ